jgi:hypothetical protein
MRHAGTKVQPVTVFSQEGLPPVVSELGCTDLQMTPVRPDFAIFSLEPDPQPAVIQGFMHNEAAGFIVCFDQPRSREGIRSGIVNGVYAPTAYPTVKSLFVRSGPQWQYDVAQPIVVVFVRIRYFQITDTE